jgi:predicted helicase
MASYAMAHFKLDMTLKETGYSGEGNSRLRVYLTNSLDEPENVTIKLPMVEWLTDEAKEANSVKKDTPVMVILGNPPYSGESSNFTPEEFLAPYKKEPGGIEKLNERNPKWLNDDYVKFIRYGQIFIEKYGDGILAFINNHSFLDNPTFRGMRWHLLQTFDKIYILDLHGNALKKETSPDGSKDENVFDIKQGVSINIFIKTGKKKQGEQAEVLHTDLYGLRKIKNIWFSKNTIKSIEWKNINPVEPFYFFAQKDFTNIDGYNEGFGIQELFAVNGVGITTAHDEFVISDNRNKLIDLFTNFKNTQGNVDLLHNTFNVRKKQGWDILKGWLNLQSENNIENFVKEIMYRPFDNKYIFYEDKLVWRTVKNIMRHFFADNNLGLIVGRQGQVVGSMAWNLIFITKNIADFNSYYRGGGTVFPLYLYPDKDVLDQTETRQPNLNADIIKTLAIKLKLQFTPEKTDDKKTFAPIDILDYIYAVLHSPTYRIKYKEFLKIDFPKVPYPSDVKQFRSFVAFGSKLRELHLLENVAPAENLAVYPMEGNNEIEKVFFEDKKVWINSKQYFAKVPQEVWDYFIGGYQPAQKWLKDRKGRTLTFDEIEHYQKIINVLKMTIELQKRIDAVLL